MTDLEYAKAALEGHSLCLCRNGITLTDDGRGISPMMQHIAAGDDLRGYAAADVIVGKAAAMLFVKAGIVRVYGKTMSEGGKQYLEAHGIPCEYSTLTDRIINRDGTDICPMERTVLDIDDCEAGYLALRARLDSMRKH